MRFLFLWIGLDPIPEWRMRNIDIFKSFHPEVEVNFVWDKRESADSWGESDLARIEYCSEGEYRGWIDSDIELLAPLPLDDRPALAYEAFPHHSICWSGNRPELFKCGSVRELFDNLRRADNVQMIKPDGLYRHWATDKNGLQVPRLTMGYKQEDFA